MKLEKKPWEPFAERARSVIRTLGDEDMEEPAGRLARFLQGARLDDVFLCNGRDRNGDLVIVNDSAGAPIVLPIVDLLLEEVERIAIDRPTLGQPVRAGSPVRPWHVRLEAIEEILAAVLSPVF